MKIQKVTDPAFRRYGKVLEGYNFGPLLKEMKHTPVPEDVVYVPSAEELEALDVEKELKNRLKSYIRNGEADKYAGPAIHFGDFGQIIEYIKTQHEIYLKKERNITDDIGYILNVCCQVFQGVCHLSTGSMPARIPAF